MNSIVLSLVLRRVPICDLGLGARLCVPVYPDSEFSEEVVGC